MASLEARKTHREQSLGQVDFATQQELTHSTTLSKVRKQAYKNAMFQWAASGNASLPYFNKPMAQHQQPPRVVDTASTSTRPS